MNHDETITGLRLLPGPGLVSQSLPMPRKWAIGFDRDGPVNDQLAGFGDVEPLDAEDVLDAWYNQRTTAFHDRSLDAATVGDVSRPFADQLKACFRGESGRVPMNFAGFSDGWASKEPPLWLFRDYWK